jgi:hypothetical protein
MLAHLWQKLVIAFAQRVIFLLSYFELNCCETDEWRYLHDRSGHSPVAGDTTPSRSLPNRSLEEMNAQLEKLYQLKLGSYQRK